VDEHTAYSCVVGSRAYGLDGPDSDVDRRGVFVAPTPLFWGLDRPPTHVDGRTPGLTKLSGVMRGEVTRFLAVAREA